MRFLSFALAVALAMLAGPAYAIQVPPQGQALMTYNFKGPIKFHGPQKTAPKTIGTTALTLFRKAGDACNTLMFSVTMSDKSMHSTHATGNASTGLCNYALIFQATPNLKVSTASLSSCNDTFADIAVDPALFVFDKTNTLEIDFSETS